MAVELFSSVMKGKINIESSGSGLVINIYLDKNTASCGLEMGVPK
jgi:hypothetical protein